MIELMMVIVIIGLAASGLTFSLGALSRASLKSAAGRLAAASRYAYNRAVVQGTTTMPPVIKDPLAREAPTSLSS